MVGAIALDGIRGFMTVDAGTTVDVFRAFITHQLIANLRPGDIVVMDNLSAHKDGKVLEYIGNAGAQVMFIPPYSPEFNPIEKTWSKLKDIVRRAHTLTRRAFDRAVANALALVTRCDIRAWFDHCGYRVP